MKRKSYDDWIKDFPEDATGTKYLMNLKRAKLRFILRRSKSLGYYIYDKADNEYSWRAAKYNGEMIPIWIKPRSFKRRERLGLPKPRQPRRKRTILPDSMFSLNELELASQIMEEMT